MWRTDTSFRPLSASGIGGVESGQNVYFTRLRIVPRRVGSLEIPPIAARQGGRTGRSAAHRLDVEAVPLEGRPPSFLGGVGDFSVHATAGPTTVRVGQVFTYSVEITGPAAWGSVSPPDLSRLHQTPLAPRVEARPNQFLNEPPSRSFVYHVRPTRAGAAILPPVTVAAFDPGSGRFITRATRGLPITAVAVSTFDPRTLNYNAPQTNQRGWTAMVWLQWTAGLAALLTGVSLAAAIRRRRIAALQSGPIGAQRFARRLVLLFRSTPRNMTNQQELVARKAVEGLIAYARIGAGRPPGALTPTDARSIVTHLTGSAEFGTQAAALVDRCDRVLFAQCPSVDGAPGREISRLARNLFEALGRAPAARGARFSEPPAPENA
jgi:hypothetical protein